MKQNRLASHFRSQTSTHSPMVLFPSSTASPRLIGGYLFNQNQRIVNKTLSFANVVESNCFEAKPRRTCLHLFGPRETLGIVACYSSAMESGVISSFEE